MTQNTRNQSHLEAGYDREMFLMDLAHLCNHMQELLLAADKPEIDTISLEQDVARRLKNVTVIHTNIYQEQREAEAQSRARLRQVLLG